MHKRMLITVLAFTFSYSNLQSMAVVCTPQQIGNAFRVACSLDNISLTPNFTLPNITFNVNVLLSQLDPIKLNLFAYITKDSVARSLGIGGAVAGSKIALSGLNDMCVSFQSKKRVDLLLNQTDRKGMTRKVLFRTGLAKTACGTALAVTGGYAALNPDEFVET